MDNDQEEYLQLGAAAELLGVSRFKLRGFINDGLLPVYESLIDARQKLVRREDVLALRTPRRIDPSGEDTKKAAA